MEALEEALQQLVRIVNPLGILAHDPDHGSPGLGLIQGVQVLAQGGDHALVPGDQHTVSTEAARAAQGRPSRGQERQADAPRGE